MWVFTFMEIWKSIEGYEGSYEISNLGRVKSLIRKSPGTNTTVENYLKKTLSRAGYYQYVLSKKGRSNKFLLHRLLMIYFVKNPFNKPCVNHINGIRSDNDFSNLEWCTYSENSLHGYRSNNRKNARRKLTETQVLEIKESLKNYYHGLGKQLAKKYSVSVWIISLIRKNKTYIKENLG